MSEVINPRRTPLKGQPDFTAISDTKMREYQNAVQDMIFAYKYYDKEATEVLKKIWKHLSDNLTDRLEYDTIQALSVDTSDVTMDNDLLKKPFKKPKIIKVLKSI